MSEIFVNPSNPLQQLKDWQQKTDKQGQEKSSDFAHLLKDALQEADALQKVSGEQVEKVLSGEIHDVHSAMIAMQEADLSFQMMMQVRNKLVEAYHEIMRMQV